MALSNKLDKLQNNNNNLPDAVKALTGEIKESNRMQKQQSKAIDQLSQQVGELSAAITSIVPLVSGLQASIDTFATVSSTPESPSKPKIITPHVDSLKHAKEFDKSWLDEQENLQQHLTTREPTFPHAHTPLPAEKKKNC